VQLAQQRYDTAMESLNKAVALNPANPQAMYQRALVYTATGKLDAARRELMAVLEHAPHEVHILVQLGRTNKRLGHTAEAVDVLNLALRVAATDKDANMIKNMLASLQEGGDDDDGIY